MSDVFGFHVPNRAISLYGIVFNHIDRIERKGCSIALVGAIVS